MTACGTAARAAATLAAALTLTSCGGASAGPRTVPGLEGSIVDIGGRYLYFECVGEGSPTVLLEAGSFGTTRSWRDVQPRLAAATRTCSYDRAGLGGSAALPGVHDAADELGDLEQLLERADIEPPYILVGHSYGGLLALLFAQAHPDDIVGVVLVDALHPDFRRTALALVPEGAGFGDLRWEFARAVVGSVDLRASEQAARRVRALATRLVVLGAGQTQDPDLPPDLDRSLRRLWDAYQERLAALSGDSVHVVALRSDHVVQSRLTGQPEVVVRAVRAVVDAEREAAGLAACARIFRGLPVRCVP
ncbi:MAG: alpha/beta hydrolase [Thermoleophilia bacterium]|nr:alpha/beta hydrolase [Thermoleophilia bacterium]